MNIIVISPHPDDETLGCGGTLLKHKNKNNNLYWIIITSPSIKEGYKKGFVNKRSKEIEEVSNRYLMDDIFQLSYSPAQLDKVSLKDLSGDISNIFKKINPEIIYLPNRNDVHSDHKVTFDAVFSCTKSFRYPSIKKVLMYETISETEFAPPLKENVFQPNSFSDISDYMEEKLNIMKIYSSEIGKHPFPRSEKNVKALATYRGAIAGVKYAEAFMILKEII